MKKNIEMTGIITILLMLTLAVCMFVFPASGDDTEVQVTINAPEYVSGIFDAAIDIVNVTDLDSGHFDISYDANVVNVTGIDSGNIDGTEVPLVNWAYQDSDTVRLLFNLPNTTGISGSGTLVTIHFTVNGTAGDTSTLEITDGMLVDIESDPILSTWSNAEITAGIPVKVNGPNAVCETFVATIDITDAVDLDSGQFNLSFDANIVNVTGVTSGNIGETDFIVDYWEFIDNSTIGILFNLPGVDGFSGSGTLAEVHFTIMGKPGDIIALTISDGLLVDIDSNEILALWSDTEIPVGVPVMVSAPEAVSGTFDATIDIESIIDMNAGQFDLSFDPAVVNVSDVIDGSIDGTAVPIAGWRFMDEDTIRVLFKLPGADGVSGSGYLAKVAFVVTGSSGETSILEISDGKITDTNANVISAVWIEGEVMV